MARVGGDLMNVLVLHSQLGVLRGGGENFTRNLFVAFAARGHKVAAAFVPRARNMALRAIAALPLPARPAALREALAQTAEGDPTPEVRAAARRVLEGRPFDEEDPK